MSCKKSWAAFARQGEERGFVAAAGLDAAERCLRDECDALVRRDQGICLEGHVQMHPPDDQCNHPSELNALLCLLDDVQDEGLELDSRVQVAREFVTREAPEASYAQGVVVMGQLLQVFDELRAAGRGQESDPRLQVARMLAEARRLADELVQEQGIVIKGEGWDTQPDGWGDAESGSRSILALLNKLGLQVDLEINATAAPEEIEWGGPWIRIQSRSRRGEISARQREILSGGLPGVLKEVEGQLVFNVRQGQRCVRRVRQMQTLLAHPEVIAHVESGATSIVARSRDHPWSITLQKGRHTFTYRLDSGGHITSEYRDYDSAEEAAKDIALMVEKMDLYNDRHCPRCGLFLSEGEGHTCLVEPMSSAGLCSKCGQGRIDIDNRCQRCGWSPSSAKFLRLTDALAKHGGYRTLEDLSAAVSSGWTIVLPFAWTEQWLGPQPERGELVQDLQDVDYFSEHNSSLADVLGPLASQLKDGFVLELSELAGYSMMDEYLPGNPSLIEPYRRLRRYIQQAREEVDGMDLDTQVGPEDSLAVKRHRLKRFLWELDRALSVAEHRRAVSDGPLMGQVAVCHEMIQVAEDIAAISGEALPEESLAQAQQAMEVAQKALGSMFAGASRDWAMQSLLRTSTPLAEYIARQTEVIGDDLAEKDPLYRARARYLASVAQLPQLAQAARDAVQLDGPVILVVDKSLGGPVLAMGGYAIIPVSTKAGPMTAYGVVDARYMWEGDWAGPGDVSPVVDEQCATAEEALRTLAIKLVMNRVPRQDFSGAGGAEERERLLQSGGRLDEAALFTRSNLDETGFGNVPVSIEDDQVVIGNGTVMLRRKGYRSWGQDLPGWEVLRLDGPSVGTYSVWEAAAKALEVVAESRVSRALSRALD